MPLAMGLSCGEIVLTVAILSILVTAPLGAICIDQTYKRLLDGSEKGESDGKSSKIWSDLLTLRGICAIVKSNLSGVGTNCGRMELLYDSNI